jgi:DNA primase
MSEDLERLKQRVPLLEYLQRHHWRGHRVGAGHEFAGLCPLHDDTHPSLYVNAQKNLFYCHGCGVSAHWPVNRPSVKQWSLFLPEHLIWDTVQIH